MDVVTTAYYAEPSTRGVAMLIFVWAWLSLILLMTGVWIYFRATGIPNAVDVAWPIGHWLVGTLYLFSTMTTRTIVLWCVLTLWALRLAGYLYWTRVRVGMVDKRYMSNQSAIGYFLNFQFQGLLIMLTVSSLYFTGRANAQTLNLLDGLALCIIMIGIIFSTVADLQLRRFVKQNNGQVCNVGLWYYSRHPNYFFEWLVWVGFAITAWSTPYGFLGIISPLTLYLIMTQITGPMTERGSLESKPIAYKVYQAKTPAFFPWRFKN